jgi:hypothetical protein
MLSSSLGCSGMTDAFAKARIIGAMENATKLDLLWLVDKTSSDEAENVNIIDLKGDMWFLHSITLGPSASRKAAKQKQRVFLVTRM